MKISIKHLLFFAFLLLPAMAYGQGSGSTAPAETASTSSRISNFAVTRSLNGTVLSSGKSSVVLKTSNGKRVSFRLTRQTKLSRGCLKQGSRVRVTYTTKDRRATRVACR